MVQKYLNQDSWRDSQTIPNPRIKVQKIVSSTRIKSLRLILQGELIIVKSKQRTVKYKTRLTESRLPVYYIPTEEICNSQINPQVYFKTDAHFRGEDSPGYH